MNKLVSSRHAAGRRWLHEPHLLSGSWIERWTDSLWQYICQFRLPLQDQPLTSARDIGVIL